MHNGNVYTLTNKSYPQSPPNYKGRFSNGKVWIEYLAMKYQANLIDKAFGYATSEYTNNEIDPSVVISSLIYSASQLVNNLEPRIILFPTIPLLPNSTQNSTFTNHNKILKNSLDSFSAENPDVEVFLYPFDEVLLKFRKSADLKEKLNITNIFNNCTSYADASNVCENPENYMLWDEVHLTTKVYEYIANDVYNRLICL
ncbi:14633_t:CDS:2 [Gigaspora margarita]|uniref:14633_t:CDS:1 n=1 Tax=Gigaspora margarita TaxID=4874 RepID=A0ABN7UW05_GIGMA|nr:14633_t:CDS:2 [Gigaspora margarita]